MKTEPAAVLAHLAGPVTTTNNVILVVRQDGVSKAFTDADVPLTYGAVTYTPAGGFNRSAWRESVGTQDNSLQLTGLIDSAQISTSDMRAGRYIDAEVYFGVINRKDPAAGIVPMGYGRIGEVRLVGNNLWVAELRSLEQALSITTGNRYGGPCGAELGDARCGVLLDPPAWVSGPVTAGTEVKASAYDARRYIAQNDGDTDVIEPAWDTTLGNSTTDGTVSWLCAEAWTKQLTVSGVTDRRTFYDAARAEPDDWFTHGKVRWLTGANAGITAVVKAYTQSGGQIVTRHPLPFAIAPGDTALVNAGCNHLLRLEDGSYGGDCKVKFDKVVRFRGHPELQGTRRLIGGGGT